MSAARGRGAGLRHGAPSSPPAPGARGTPTRPSGSARRWWRSCSASELPRTGMPVGAMPPTSRAQGRTPSLAGELERAHRRLQGPQPPRAETVPEGGAAGAVAGTRRSGEGATASSAGRGIRRLATASAGAPVVLLQQLPSANWASREKRAFARPCFTRQVSTPSSSTRERRRVERLRGAVAQAQRTPGRPVDVHAQHPVGRVLHLDEAPVVPEAGAGTARRRSGTSAGVEGLDDLRVLDRLAVVPPAAARDRGGCRCPRGCASASGGSDGVPRSSRAPRRAGSSRRGRLPVAGPTRCSRGRPRRPRSSPARRAPPRACTQRFRSDQPPTAKSSSRYGRVVEAEAEAELHVAGVLVEEPGQRAGTATVSHSGQCSRGRCLRQQRGRPAAAASAAATARAGRSSAGAG